MWALTQSCALRRGMVDEAEARHVWKQKPLFPHCVQKDLEGRSVSPIGEEKIISLFLSS